MGAINASIRSCVRSAAHSVLARRGAGYPASLALLYDADKAPTRELTGKGHKFNSAILSPQYQHNADGSYADVGANPAVDVIDGEKWLRSCGAVTNMLTNSVFAGAVSGTPGTAPTGWIRGGTGGAITVSDNSITFIANNDTAYITSTIAILANTTYNFLVDIVFDGVLLVVAAARVGTSPAGCVTSFYLDNVLVNSTDIPTAGIHKVGLLISNGATTGTISIRIGCGTSSTATTGTATISNPQLTATAYPLPYVPTTTAGPVTMPASNATTTNGCWFTLADGSPLWKALTGQPLTLATRVRMGVGSGDLPNSASLPILTSKTASVEQYCDKSVSGLSYIIGSYDGTTYKAITSEWNRNSIIRRATQVNTAGTQFRVGYMIEGTHTAIQWSSWTNYDSSFNPSTLYRLMLGYNNAYPMWFNKIAVWNKQMDDAAILEALS